MRVQRFRPCTLGGSELKIIPTNYDRPRTLFKIDVFFRNDPRSHNVRVEIQSKRAYRMHNGERRTIIPVYFVTSVIVGGGR